MREIRRALVEADASLYKLCEQVVGVGFTRGVKPNLHLVKGACESLTNLVTVVEASWKMSCSVNSVSQHVTLPPTSSAITVLYAKKLESCDVGLHIQGLMMLFLRIYPRRRDGSGSTARDL
ncbi:hypothetical protein MKW98_014747 [Papaver atlanticum]|uniref:Uncharacterized protein n=1 Tax=Papaver atlanticum TaxID=357466 RepID=A0AAD4SGT0_9MAGN|nr:hypothetical protein MKW98_014747 [Papaver atlanticum]